MDLKLKGKSWAGNIYHQFETICQDVDDFMSKDTVKFVENQVQSVGVSVKRFYSNVVQDILPLSGDIVEPKAQTADGEGAHENLPTDVRAQLICANENELSVNQGSVDTSRNSDASLPIELDHSVQFSWPPYADPSQEAKPCLHSSEDGDVTVSSETNNSLEENHTKDLALISDSICGDHMSSGMSNGDHQNLTVAMDSSTALSAHEAGTSDEDHKNSTLTMDSSSALSPHEVGLLPMKKESISCNSFSDVTEYQCNISISGCAFESELPMIENVNSDENINLSAPSETSADKLNECEYMTMDSSLPSASNATDRALGTDGALCDNLSTKDENFVSWSIQSPELVFSNFSVEERMGAVPPTCSTSPKSSNILESRSSNFIKKDESFCHSPSESDGSAYNVSTLSEAAGCKTKAVDVLPAFLISELNDNNAFWTDGSDFVVGSSESWHEQDPGIVQPKFSISPSKIAGNTYGCGVITSDLNMETIDLSPDAKQDRESVLLNNSLVHSASHGRRNFRYYKKLIQHALTSRKRLSKEYEHLAILYGDIDMESSRDFQPSSAPSSPSTYVQAVRTQSFQDMCETEWELL